MLSCFTILSFYPNQGDTIDETSSHVELVDSEQSNRYIGIVTSDNKWENLDFDKYMAEKEAKKKEEEEVRIFNETMKQQYGVENILLIGIDTRSKNLKSGRADTIMVASIDSNKSTIKLISIMRDTYVQIPRYKSNRINATYAFGGPELLMTTIEKNFNIPIDKYIVVNFYNFEKVIDTLGGVNVNIKPYEIKAVNSCLAGLKRSTSNYIKNSGVQLLNGAQALAYCRIRKVGNGDYERTERQRAVIENLINQFQDLSISKYPSLIATVYPNVMTNLSLKDCINLARFYLSKDSWNIEGIQIPNDSTGKARTIRSMYVIYPNIQECNRLIHNFLSEK